MPPPPNIIATLADSIFDFINRVPQTNEGVSLTPQVHAQRIAKAASRRAALTAGTLALPPGVFGWLTILPELIGIWKIQGQMVADIAAVYGKRTSLGREQMVYCLFRHVAAQAIRDVAVRVGQRLIFRRMTRAALQNVTQKVGVRITQRAVGKGISRWLPLVGAIGVGAYAYYDTTQVAATAINLFEDDVEYAV